MKIINKKILIISGAVAVVIIALVIFLVFFEKEPIRMSVLPPAAKEDVKQKNPGPTLDISNNTISPKSFMVEYPGRVSLVVIPDNQSHELVFSKGTTSLEKIVVKENEVKKIDFTVPEPGTYTLACVTPGHKEKGEVGEMIVSPKPEKTNKPQEVKQNSEIKIPGASMVIKDGVITPSTLTVAKDASVFLTFKSEDNLPHIITFSDKTIKTDLINIGSGEEKSTTFKATKAGEYEFHCMNPNHKTESGKMIVK